MKPQTLLSTSALALVAALQLPQVEAGFSLRYYWGTPGFGGGSACHCEEDVAPEPGDYTEDPYYENYEDCCNACEDCTLQPIEGPRAPTGGAKGDPHIESWTGEWFDYMGECDLKLLHAPEFDEKQDMDIHIRTTIRRDYSFIEAAALKIGNDVLELGSFGDYTLNGVESALDFGNVPTVGGYPVHTTHIDDTKQILKFDVVIGDHKNVTLKTMKDWVSVQVTNGDRASFGKVSGLMGSFDGGLLSRDGTDMHDDINSLGQDWQVQPGEEMLFRTAREPQAPQPCRLPSSKSSQEARRLGHGLSETEAVQACAHVKGSSFDLCVEDVMASGDLDVALAF